MYELNKERFGAFVAQLRKEKGLTQKELAGRLFVSNKAVSKWETGVSIPDMALLFPLAEALGVTVTELLLCEKQGSAMTMDAQAVDQVVQTAIQYAEKAPRRAYHVKSRWGIAYLVSLLVGGAAVFASRRLGLSGTGIDTMFFLLVFFGGYFCFFVPVELPAYYDQYRVHTFGDGIFQMNMVGLAFNNRNWPHIVRMLRIWSCATTGGLPLLDLFMNKFFPGFWSGAGNQICIALMLGGLFLPLYLVGKRYETE